MILEGSFSFKCGGKQRKDKLGEASTNTFLASKKPAEEVLRQSLISNTHINAIGRASINAEITQPSLQS